MSLINSISNGYVGTLYKVYTIIQITKEKAFQCFVIHNSARFADFLSNGYILYFSNEMLLLILLTKIVCVLKKFFNSFSFSGLSNIVWSI